MRGKFLKTRFSLVLLVAATACLLLALSWPRLSASVRYLPVDTAMSSYWDGTEFDYTQLDGLINTAEQAIAIHDHYRYWDGLSELYIIAGGDLQRSFWQRREALKKSISTAGEVVQRAPAKPRSWLRIARAMEFLAYPPEEIISALKMSILTGRVEPTLMLIRLELGLRQLSELDREALSLLRDQAVLTWTVQQRPMLKRIRDGSISSALLRKLLVDHQPGVLAEMESRFDQ